MASAFLLAGAAAPSGELLPSLTWRRVAEGVHGGPVSALAVRPGSSEAVGKGQQLAVGDALGVRVRKPSGGFARLLHRGPVLDLAFLPPQLLEGAGDAGSGLLAATAVGLYRVAGDGVRVVRAAPGDEARVVHRLGVVPSAVAVASDAGAFLSSDTRRWQRLSLRLPRAPSTAVALRETHAGLESFAIVDGKVWWVSLTASPEGWRELDARRESFASAVASESPVDVVFDAGGEDVVVVFPSAFAVRARDSAGWRLVNPALPPGARARRLHDAHGWLWLATDRGLLAATQLRGPWRRTPSPAGTADVHSVASDAESVYVAAGERVLAADLRSLRPRSPVRRVDPADPALALRTPEGDPPIEQVQRAALAYLELERGPIDSMRRGVGRRGWLPLMSFRATRAHDRDDRTDFDEAFTSGALRRLVDRERSTARDFEVSLNFTWDLGDVAYHPEQIDVSREAREVIKLRDDVLDEVTQLYFERRRVLVDLTARPDAAPEELLRLRMRAAELAAGIDAWTGGWFGRARGSGRP